MNNENYFDIFLANSKHVLAKESEENLYRYDISCYDIQHQSLCEVCEEGSIKLSLNSKCFLSFSQKHILLFYQHVTCHFDVIFSRVIAMLRHPF